jgi:hypothetical protein
MSTAWVSPAIKAEILRKHSRGVAKRQIAREVGHDERTVRRIVASAGNTAKATTRSEGIVYHDKKIGGYNWRDSIPAIQGLQKLRKSAAWSQRTAEVTVGDGNSPIGLICFGDQHIGAAGTDYDLFVQLTDMLLNTPNLYCILMGDEVEMAIKLRGVAEVCAQILDPFMQSQFIESWITEVRNKVIASTWSNHSTERQEAAAGSSEIKNILAKNVVFFSGIGHLTVNVGKQSYNIAINHKFAGASALNPTGGCEKYMRFEWQDADAAIQGDIHRTQVKQYRDGNKQRVAISSGSLHIHSGYADRYFSMFTSTAFPVLTLYPDAKRMVPFFCVQDYLDVTKLAIAA